MVEFVQGWSPCRLKDLVVRRTERNADPSATVLTISASAGLIDQATYFKRVVAGADISAYYTLGRGDFVYSKSYSAGHPMGVIRRLHRHESGVVSPLYICFRAKQDVVDPDFLDHLFRAGALDQRLALIAKEGARNHGLLNVGTRDFFDLVVDVPQLDEQRRIAEILRTVDACISGTEKVIAKRTLEREGTLRDQLRALRESPMSTVSELGAVVTVGIVVRPTQYYTPQGVPVLRSANVREGRVDLSDLVYMSKTAHSMMRKTAVRPGDLVTVRTGHPGTTAVVPLDLPEANCVDILITRTMGQVDPEFLAIWTNSDFGKGHVLARQGGLAQQHFNVSDMKALPVPLVELEEQRRLVELDRALVDALNAEKDGLEKLRGVRVGLAHDLLSGRVRTVAG